MSESIPVISAKELHKTYTLGDIDVHALNGITLDIKEGEFVSIMGASGSGKSTFMNIIGCLDKPTKGVYHLDGQEVSGLSHDELAEIRNTKIGFFQVTETFWNNISAQLLASIYLMEMQQVFQVKIT